MRVKRRQSANYIWPLSLLLIAAVSFGLATLWQSMQDNGLQPQTSSSDSSTSDSTSESASISDSESISASDTSATSQSTTTSSSESASASGSDTTPADGYLYPVEGAVPQSEWVETTYFDDAMFVGDSITHGMQIYGALGKSVVIAHTGINPDTILTKEVIRTSSGTVTILDAMKQYTPAKIYIMLGANGVAFIDKDTMMELYGSFIDKVKAQHPDSTIYVQSILPVTAEKSKDPIYSNTRIDDYNVALLQLTKDKGVHYLNVAEAFKNESGALPAEASPKDGMHFGPAYYTKWFDYLKTHTV